MQNTCVFRGLLDKHSYTGYVYHEMKNITLAVPEDTLREVRKIAAERETTVNALVREYLERLAAHKKRRARLKREIEAFATRTQAAVGTVHWSREDSHER